MKKSNVIVEIYFLLFLIFIFPNCELVGAGTFSNKNNSDIIVSIDERIFTKYDLINFFNIQKIIGLIKYNTLSDDNYKKLLDGFIEYQLRKKIIDYKDGQLTGKKAEEFWDNNKFKFGTEMSLNAFCSMISIDKDFFVDYMNFFQKWQEYLMGEAVRDIRVNNEDVYEYLEIVNKNNTNFKQMEYDLYEITLYFDGEEEKTEVIDKMAKIRKKTTNKNFQKMMKKYSQSSTQEMERYMENELSSIMLANLKDLNIGDISKVSCVKENKGICAIYYLIDKKMSQPQLEEQEMISLKNSLYIRQIEKKVHNLLIKQKNNSNIKYY